MPVGVMKRFFTNWRISNPMRRSLSGKSESTIFCQMIQFGKNWIPIGFFLVMREVSKIFPIIRKKDPRIEHTALYASIKETNY